MRLAYLHGFASGPKSRKAQRLAEAFEGLRVPDLNRPSFERLSLAAMLEAVDAMDAEHGTDEGWGLVGSSLGGWVAARWAALRPERVRRLLLLCPAFDIPARWPELLPTGALALWERTGSLPFADGAGELRKVHYGFYLEALEQPRVPDVPPGVPTVIVHGTRDDRVPIEGSRRYAGDRAHVRVVEVDDGHDLLASSDRVVELARAHFA